MGFNQSGYAFGSGSKVAKKKYAKGFWSHGIVKDQDQ
jgi:hypothetical protein